jgi:hypothetical protein
VSIRCIFPSVRRRAPAEHRLLLRSLRHVLLRPHWWLMLVRQARLKLRKLLRCERQLGQAPFKTNQ